MRFLWVLVFLTASFAAYAQTDIPPPTNEYDHVKPGVLLPDNAEAAAADQASGIAAPDDSGAGSTEAMTIEDIVAAWHAGKMDLVVKHVTPLAENGHHQAEEILGILYHTGQGVPKDTEKALQWLNKAAEAGRPLAQHHMGVIYFTGDGVPPDPVKGLMWLHIAIAHYPEGDDKKRAIQDRDNAAASLSRRDRDRAMELAREWLDKKGEGHLLDLQ